MRRLGCIAFNVAATKISSNCTRVLEKSLNWQEKMSEVREKSVKGKYLGLSLQCLDIK